MDLTTLLKQTMALKHKAAGASAELGGSDPKKQKLTEPDKNKEEGATERKKREDDERKKKGDDARKKMEDDERKRNEVKKKTREEEERKNKEKKEEEERVRKEEEERIRKENKEKEERKKKEEEDEHKKKEDEDRVIKEDKDRKEREGVKVKGAKDDNKEHDGNAMTCSSVYNRVVTLESQLETMQEIMANFFATVKPMQEKIEVLEAFRASATVEKKTVDEYDQKIAKGQLI